MLRAFLNYGFNAQFIQLISIFSCIHECPFLHSFFFSADSGSLSSVLKNKWSLSHIHYDKPSSAFSAGLHHMIQAMVVNDSQSYPYFLVETTSVIGGFITTTVKTSLLPHKVHTKNPDTRQPLLPMYRDK